ncbi:hypothetical protein TNCT_217871 [Trichonephila clavata]|uniref:Uncharacterized protein n=1 Tax=Trichonephila clavata TaxID=2740835 RepID=A0A8X6HB52_TRICU|nr:hypothetical protein TNCT_217871 [Trichonephila clavata]
MFLANIDDNTAYYEIPANLVCAHPKGHLVGRALDWSEVIGYSMVSGETTHFATLKQELTDRFPVLQNRSEFEAQFFS